MTRDYTTDQLRQGQKSAAAALIAHRKACPDYLLAFHRHRVEECCQDGYQLLLDLRAASRALHDRIDAVEAAASRQPTLFDTLEE